MVLSSSFSQLLASSLAKKDSMLHPAAKKAMSRIQAIAEQSKDPDTKAAFAVVLQRQPGSTLSQHVKSTGTSGMLQVRDSASIRPILMLQHRSFYTMPIGVTQHSEISRSCTDESSIPEGHVLRAVPYTNPLYV